MLIAKLTLSRVYNISEYNTHIIDTLCMYFECTPCELLEYYDERKSRATLNQQPIVTAMMHCLEYPMPSIDMIDELKALKLFGMASAYEETLNTAIHEEKTMAQFLSQLCHIEHKERQSRSISYQMSVAKFPVNKGMDTFMFNDTPINEQQVRALYQGEFINQCRNILLVGGTGSGKSHLAIAVASNAIRHGKRGRFYSVIDLVNKLEQEARNGEAGGLVQSCPK